MGVYWASYVDYIIRKHSILYSIHWDLWYEYHHLIDSHSPYSNLCLLLQWIDNEERFLNYQRDAVNELRLLEFTEIITFAFASLR